jgi:hypothetical protein
MWNIGKNLQHKTDNQQFCLILAGWQPFAINTPTVHSPPINNWCDQLVSIHYISNLETIQSRSTIHHMLMVCQLSL